MIINTEPCCYGFFNDQVRSELDGRWEAPCQRPFRGHWLWLWGAAGALLTSLVVNGDEQLELAAGEGLPFEAMRRNVSVSPGQFLSFIPGEFPAPSRFDGTVVSAVLASSFGAPHIMLPTSHVGSWIRFGFRGGVLGIVLVGEQLR